MATAMAVAPLVTPPTAAAAAARLVAIMKCLKYRRRFGQLAATAIR
jgi:hypothetical protein